MEEVIGNLIGLIIPVVLIFVGLFAGRAAERKHYRNLALREQALANMLVTDIKTFPGGYDPSKGAALVQGEAVIATDYLKSFLAGLRNIFGGELKSYETLMVRARREAILRMMESAQRMGYNAVCNLRMGTADIGGMTGKRGAAMVEAFASGTAYAIPTEEAQ